MDTILSERQTIDILVNNARYALVCPLEETLIDEMKIPSLRLSSLEQLELLS